MYVANPFGLGVTIGVISTIVVEVVALIALAVWSNKGE